MLRSFLSALCLLGLLTAEAPAQTPKGGKVTLVIRLPAEAELSIGSQKMALTGAERRFESPALEPGDYAYELTVTWKKEGAEVRQSKTVTCKPGQTVAVEFKAQAESPKLAESPKVADTPKVTETKSPAIEPAKSKTAEAKTRTFQFTYAGKVTELKPGQSARVWLPLPQSNPEQIVVIQQTKVPGDFQIDKDRTYGNQILHFTGKANEKGEIPFEIVVKAARKEVKTDVQANLTVKPSEDPSLLDRFLKPDALVPTSGKSLELIKDQKLPADQFQAAKVLYDVVNNHMKYSKEGKGWGRGDSEWACDSKFGNCTDFHSLFISMARGNKIAAKLFIDLLCGKPPEKRPRQQDPFEVRDGFPDPGQAWRRRDQGVPLLGVVHAREEGLGARRHLRGQPQSRPESILLRQPERKPYPVHDRPRHRPDAEAIGLTAEFLRVSVCRGRECRLSRGEGATLVLVQGPLRQRAGLLFTNPTRKRGRRRPSLTRRVGEEMRLSSKWIVRANPIPALPPGWGFFLKEGFLQSRPSITKRGVHATDRGDQPEGGRRQDDVHG